MRVLEGQDKFRRVFEGPGSLRVKNDGQICKCQDQLGMPHEVPGCLATMVYRNVITDITSVLL